MRIQVVGGQAGSKTRALAGDVVQHLLQIESPAEVKNSHHEYHQQGQGHSEFQQLRTRRIGQNAAPSTCEMSITCLRTNSSPVVCTLALSWISWLFSEVNGR